MPSNDGRGYVLRKIIRRALRHARMLNAPAPFLSVMSEVVRAQMSAAYPELDASADRVARILNEEEKRFARMVTVGLSHLEEELEPLRADKSVLQGAQAFKLYDTYGLPRDFISDVAHDAGVQVDWEGFDRAMEEQRTRARASWKGVHKEAASPALTKLAETYQTEPDFYYGTKARDCRIEAIITKEGAVQELAAGAEGEVVLDRTSIYAESGGQVADLGAFWDSGGTLEVAEVRGAYYPVSRVVSHRVAAKETLRVGDRVTTVADIERRTRNRLNHTATHLMHAALRVILGTHVKQAGSLVAPDRLRFDFSHFAAVDPSDISDIEQQVNEEIRRNAELQTDIMHIDEALSSGALAFFGDKYPEANVRVVTIPDAEYPRGFYSKELCGGTHVHRAGDIGVFKIVSEQSAASGVRRIEAITGERALAEYQSTLETLRKVGALVNAGPDEAEIVAAVERQAQSLRQLEKQLADQRRKSAVSMVDSLLETVRKVKDVNVLASEVSGVDREGMRQMVDSLRQKLGSGVVILGAADDGKVALITGVTKDLTNRVQAGKIIQELARKVGGSGGGRPDLAEAGGKDTFALKSTISDAYALLERML